MALFTTTSSLFVPNNRDAHTHICMSSFFWLSGRRKWPEDDKDVRFCEGRFAGWFDLRRARSNSSRKVSAAECPQATRLVGKGLYRTGTKPRGAEELVGAVHCEWEDEASVSQIDKRLFPPRATGRPEDVRLFRNGVNGPYRKIYASLYAMRCVSICWWMASKH